MFIPIFVILGMLLNLDNFNLLLVKIYDEFGYGRIGSILKWLLRWGQQPTDNYYYAWASDWSPQFNMLGIVFFIFALGLFIILIFEWKEFKKQNE